MAMFHFLGTTLQHRFWGFVWSVFKFWSFGVLGVYVIVFWGFWTLGFWVLGFWGLGFWGFGVVVVLVLWWFGDWGNRVEAPKT